MRYLKETVYHPSTQRDSQEIKLEYTKTLLPELPVTHGRSDSLSGDSLYSDISLPISSIQTSVRR